MANISTIRPDTMSIPSNYPVMPTPGKIRLIYDANKRELYHKLSPYGYDTFLGIKTRQPFIYTYPDEAKSASEYGIVDLFKRSITDVERISKYMISRGGLTFLTKQFLMQTGNAFNETRIYNPTSPIVAAGMPITLWSVRPQRNLDMGDLLGSLLGPVGASIRSIFTTAPPRPPAGTVGVGALPTNNLAGGKGLLRGGTANSAKTKLTTKWTVQTGKGLGLGGFIGSTIKSMFGNFIPQRQGAQKRSDELTYGLMLGSSTGATGVFSYQGASTFFDGVHQYWFGGEDRSIRMSYQTPKNWKRIFTKPDGRPELIDISNTVFTIAGENIGYSVDRWDKPVKYEDHVGNDRGNSLASSGNKGSDVLIQQSMYIDESKKYPSKFTDKQKTEVQEIRASLQRVINNIRESGQYSVEQNPQSSVVMFNQEKIGYDRIAGMKNKSTDSEGRYSVLKEYRERGVRVLDDKFTSDPINLSVKMAGSYRPDWINTLTVLDGDDVRAEKKASDDSMTAAMKDWAYKPYHSDLIAFYFYDVVNDKYIPFRATIRGLQETDSANWEELSFIGRADRLYSYGGFNRSLTFSFTVHISSIFELAPTWQRLNYLMSLVKPSNYTTNPGTNMLAGQPARYIVPPMVMITIGDLYKNQPIVIGTAGIAIPESAVWETLNEENSTEWSYLANYIKAPAIGKQYGQLPRTAEISINAYILEKERAIVGAAHFGHAPHTETYVDGDYRTTHPDFTNPTELHKSFVVYNKQKASPKSPKMSG